MDKAFELVRNIVKTQFQDLPIQAIEATKKQIIDCLGVAVAGSSAEGISELVELSKEWGGSQQSSVIAFGMKLPSPNAALVNAAMIHALDYDDTHEEGVMHPGSVVIATCFAIAEYLGGISGREVITAAALGTDLMCRLGLATSSGGSRLRTGWHLTVLYGYLGATAVAGKMLGLDENQMINAFGIAYHQSSGNGQCVIDGALTKRMGPGFAAKGGITAALMAKKGITGAKNILEGDYGLYNLYLRGDYRPEVLTSELGKRFEGINVSIKPYPCCRAAHPFIDAALDLAKDHDIKPDEIKNIGVFHGKGAQILCDPLEPKQTPRNPVDSQFSIPWAVAVALIKRKVGIEDFTAATIRDPEILKISRKISPQFDDSLVRAALEPGRVEVATREGKTYSRQVENPLGSPHNKLIFIDCVKKFFDCVESSLIPISKDKQERIAENIIKFEKVEDPTEIIRLVSGS